MPAYIHLWTSEIEIATPRRAIYLNLLANPSTALSISTGAGGQPATVRSTGSTFATRPQLA